MLPLFCLSVTLHWYRRIKIVSSITLIHLFEFTASLRRPFFRGGILNVCTGVSDSIILYSDYGVDSYPLHILVELQDAKQMAGEGTKKKKVIKIRKKFKRG